MGDVARKLAPAQKAIIMRVFTFYVHSELSRDVEFEVRDMFDLDRSRNQDSAHPDDTGRIRVFCPHGVSMQPTSVDQLLYRPRKLKDATIIQYAGLESGLLESRTHVIPTTAAAAAAKDDAPLETHTEVFERNDPIVAFMFNHSETLNIQKGDITLLNPGGKAHYQIRDEFLAQVRDYFRVTVFDELRYTRFEEMHLHVDLPAATREEFYNRYRKRDAIERPQLFLVLEFVYIVVTPGEMRLRHQEEWLK